VQRFTRFVIECLWHVDELELELGALRQIRGLVDDDVSGPSQADYPPGD
jgi:hypothetical protein